MLNDFLKRPLFVGDYVVHAVGGRRRGLSGPFVVDSFTPKMVRIRRPNEEHIYSTVPPSNLVLVHVS